MVASGKMPEEKPETIEKIVDAHVKAVEFIENHQEEAKNITMKDIKKTTGQELEKEVIDLAWGRIGFTHEVDEQAVQDFADSSCALKFLKDKPDFAKLIDKTFIGQKEMAGR